MPVETTTEAPPEYVFDNAESDGLAFAGVGGILLVVMLLTAIFVRLGS